ncbi:type VI secretion system ATPase TssH [Actibacterium sp. 188UL27-1]|uniref:type VI secretion system ATPase TssH n=1 Tax=Actibacterium sp. 188UL27-1 TaxID=2786961 RepID=UPI001957F410|nr:type VI secretion system ATPase TssH [Actibacterium sp. 188UL27-1]MBM7068823.1 type VI secretion system ATPase TssH [Actibacterium sp. 188UL27-1]
MSDISLETVAGKLNRTGYDAFMKALRHAKNEGNRNVELSHWLLHMLMNDRSDITVALQHYGIDRAKVMMEVQAAIDTFKKNVTEMPGFSSHIIDMLDRGWHYATLLFGEPSIRTGHMLVALLKDDRLNPALGSISKTLAGLDPTTVANDARGAWKLSEEEDMGSMDGAGMGGAPAADGAPATKTGTTALDRFCIDMTAQAQSGEMDPIVGRDEEIRQIIDILMRRRQNNPILTGEAGVGKTAVVEGFAQRLASGDVPPQLRGVRLLSLDIGLMQAGASMKGEFEQRLRQVIDEVQGSPTPIILFVDEAHTLIGAGGAAGTGDAANLMKPALARGTLRTVTATTWMEYQKYFEKDPALTRRFQPISVDEPDIDRCCYMLRGIMTPMEAHHQVRISDEAIVAAVQLSHRYIPARQLPDKAVSLLDTAAARVAISQSTTPAAIADIQAQIASLTAELGAKERQADLGEVNEDRIAEIREELTTAEAHLAEHDAKYQTEKQVVADILDLRAQLTGDTPATLPVDDQPSDTGPEANADAADEAAQGAPEEAAPTTDPNHAPLTYEDAAALRAALATKVQELEARDPDDRMIYAHVDAQAVASVVGDWTGIPVGRMVTDEVQAILTLVDRLQERVVGQDHGLKMIAKRIETNRAKLDNPDKPIGVFMLAGPSGVGKTETALALAEAIYGGEQNVITINMSEFQEAHTVSLLKGAPPGYVGYGEGGRLTEAVRRKPYSVVLLDEVEKAHPDVHELFFQVFDKGRMEDGSGREIDFKNCLILLTSNAGTNVIMDMTARGAARPDPEALAETLRPALLEVFPPALLGRIVTIPYYPLSSEVLAMITKLKLGSIVKRVKTNHGAEMTYSDAVTDHIVAQCQDPDSGGRMIDNIITNSILPDLSRAILTKAMAGEEITAVTIDTADDTFTYAIE